ncbi:MAG: UDP-N-acetylmuramate dehydrogenase [Ruminococcaceae bacterium]|nr:UDP-N-acetylmuramate dehydrogenase [Oscillospiraceae bacterium]
MPFCKFCKDNNIPFKKNEIMKNHTSFKIGGKADFYVECCCDECLKAVVLECKKLELPYFIIGKGSNILVSDNGVEGVVISLCGFSELLLKDDVITVGAGVSLANLCNFALENSLSGLEFAYGIPGSVGGALYMNAGAYGGEMSQAVISAKSMDKDGNIREIAVGDMQLGYRKSIFKTNGEIILSVSFKLKKDNKNDIKARMDDFMSRRKDKQPLEFPSAGSTFKRPEGYFAGALIEKNNLKGVSVGGAMVSEKHAGFVINYNNATASDVKELMEKIKKIVKTNDGVDLEPEVIFIGKE